MIWTLKTIFVWMFRRSNNNKEREEKDVIMNHFLSPFMKSVMVFCVLFQRGFLTTSLRIWFISPDHDQCIFLLFKGTLFNSKIFGWNMNHYCGQMARLCSKLRSFQNPFVAPWEEIYQISVICFQSLRNNALHIWVGKNLVIFLIGYKKTWWKTPN